MVSVAKFDLWPGDDILKFWLLSHFFPLEVLSLEALKNDVALLCRLYFVILVYIFEKGLYT